MAWFDGLDADHQTHITSRGWEKLEPDAAALEAVKAHRAATAAMGGMVKMPADTADPAYQTAYDRIVGMGVPKTPEEYKFDGIRFKDGTELAEADAEFVRGVAAKHKLTLPVARALAGELAARADAMIEADHGSSELNKAANQAALHQAWNTDYDQKAFAAAKAGEAVGFTPEVLAYMATLSPPDYVKNMNALVFLGSQMNEATILRGGQTPHDPTVGMSRDMARTQFEELRSSAGWAAKALEIGTPENRLYDQLVRVMSGQPAQVR